MFDDAAALLSPHDAHFVLHAQNHTENVGLERGGKAFRGLIRDWTDLALGGGVCSPRHRDGQTARRLVNH